MWPFSQIKSLYYATRLDFAIVGGNYSAALGYLNHVMPSEDDVARLVKAIDQHGHGPLGETARACLMKAFRNGMPITEDIFNEFTQGNRKRWDIIKGYVFDCGALNDTQLNSALTALKQAKHDSYRRTEFYDIANTILYSITKQDAQLKLTQLSSVMDAFREIPSGHMDRSTLNEILEEGIKTCPDIISIDFFDRLIDTEAISSDPIVAAIEKGYRPTLKQSRRILDREETDPAHLTHGSFDISRILCAKAQATIPLTLKEINHISSQIASETQKAMEILRINDGYGWQVDQVEVVLTRKIVAELEALIHTTRNGSKLPPNAIQTLIENGSEKALEVISNHVSNEGDLDSYQLGKLLDFARQKQGFALSNPYDHEQIALRVVKPFEGDQSAYISHEGSSTATNAVFLYVSGPDTSVIDEGKTIVGPGGGHVSVDILVREGIISYSEAEKRGCTPDPSLASVPEGMQRD